MQGWHKRIIHTLPETWMNMSVPESEMGHREEPYRRTYWSITPMEVGWTFHGRVDLTAGMSFVGPPHSNDRGGLVTADGAIFTGGLALILGRTRLKEDSPAIRSK